MATVAFLGALSGNQAGSDQWSLRLTQGPPLYQAPMGFFLERVMV